MRSVCGVLLPDVSLFLLRFLGAYACSVDARCINHRGAMEEWGIGGWGKCNGSDQDVKLVLVHVM